MISFIKNYFVVFFLSLVFIASTWTLFNKDFFRVHDYLHGVRIAEMLRGVQDGQLPVRWSGNLGYGYGMPLFEFYAPLPSYVGAALYWLGFDLITSVKLLYFICTLGALIGAYKLGNIWYGRIGGALVALAFVLAPYRAVNLFVRGALSEAWGMLALPWILYFTTLVVRGKKGSWLGLTLSLTVLFLSHNLTTLMFVPFALVFAGLTYILENRNDFQDLKKFLVKRLGILIGAYIAAFGLSAFCMIPAVLEKNFTQIEQILGGYFWYGQHFLYLRQFIKPGWSYGGSVWGPDDGISFFLGFGQWLGILGFIALGAWYVKKVGKSLAKIPTGLYFGGISFALMVGALFFTLGKSEFLWNALPMLNYVQFPWRFLSIAALFGALTVGSLSLIKGKAKLLFLTGLCAVFFINASYFRPEAYESDLSSLYTGDAEKIKTGLSQILPDYIPQGIDLNIAPVTSLISEPADIQVKALVERSHQKLFSISLASEQTVVLSIAQYPGWVVEIDGIKQEVRTSPSGLVAITIPEGTHIVGAYLEKTPVQRAADILTVISFITILVILSLSRSSQKKHD